MVEKDVELALVKRVKEMGGIAFKFVSPSRRSVPDRLCLFPGGRVVFVECKAPGKRPTVAQVKEHERLKALGFAVLVVDGVENVKQLQGD